MNVGEPDYWRVFAMHIEEKQLFEIQYYHASHRSMAVRSMIEHRRQKHRVIIFMKGVKFIQIPSRFMCNYFGIDSQDENSRSVKFYDEGALIGAINVRDVAFSVDEKEMSEPTGIGEFDIIMRSVPPTP